MFINLCGLLDTLSSDIQNATKAKLLNSIVYVLFTFVLLGPSKEVLKNKFASCARCRGYSNKQTDMALATAELTV